MLRRHSLLKLGEWATPNQARYGYNILEENKLGLSKESKHDIHIWVHILVERYLLDPIVSI